MERNVPPQRQLRRMLHADGPLQPRLLLPDPQDGAQDAHLLPPHRQVEHPVTELITGLDLVALQIRVAQGEALGFTQEDVSLTGHAIEARLYAEDVSNDFLPATGTVALWEPAQQNGQGNGIRIDAGIDTGSEISPFYDPMIAKVMAFGASREEARLKLIHALKDTAIMGLTTNTSFLIDVLERPAFAKGEATTAFIGENFTAEDLQGEALMPRDAALVAVLQYELSREVALGHALHVETTLHNWTSASAIATPYIYGDIALHVTPLSDRHYKVAYGDEVFTVTCLSREAHRAVMLKDSILQKELFILVFLLKFAHSRIGDCWHACFLLVPLRVPLGRVRNASG